MLLEKFFGYIYTERERERERERETDRERERDTDARVFGRVSAGADSRRGGP